jgi:sulfite reductase (NADPH) flavoprotein alpha-component
MKWFPKKKDQAHTDTHIVYATGTGNSRHVAKMAYQYYKKQGLPAKVHDISNISPDDLKDFQHLLFVVSTIGEGEPPLSARSFYSAVNSEQMCELSHLRYSVCALGDSSYEYFCEAGKAIDRRLQELNARPLHPRVDCDADFAEPAIGWIRSTFGELKN